MLLGLQDLPVPLPVSILHEIDLVALLLPLLWLLLLLPSLTVDAPVVLVSVSPLNLLLLSVLAWAPVAFVNLLTHA